MANTNRSIRPNTLIKSAEHSGGVILNGVPYTGVSSLYDDASVAPKHLKLGIRVTVTLSPTLDIVRYPNLVRNTGSKKGFSSPVISDDDRASINERRRWYNDAKKTNVADTRKLAAQRKLLAKDQERLALAEKALAAAKKRGASVVTIQGLRNQVLKWERRVSARTSNIRELRRRLNRISTYSTTYDITHYLKGMSWSSTDENSHINLNLEVDNTQGLFNYLPVGAKIIVWRRKSLITRSTKENNVIHDTGKWYPYMQVYLSDKDVSISGRENTMSLSCFDRMARLSRLVPKKKVYKTDKKHPKGWTPREITIDICKAEGIPYDPAKIPNRVITRVKDRNKKGVVIPGRLKVISLPRLEKFDVGEDDKTAAGMLSAVWRDSVDDIPPKFGVTYPNMHMRTGKFVVEFLSPVFRDTVSPNSVISIDNVVPISSSQQTQLIAFDENNIESIKFTERTSDNVVGSDRLIGATATEPQKTYTELSAKGKFYMPVTVGKNKKRKRITKTATYIAKPDNHEMIWAAFGRIRHTHNFKKRIFKSEQAFRQAADAMVNRAIEPTRTLEITGKAPLGLWPYKYVYITSRAIGLRGRFPIQSVNYSVASGVVSVSLTLLLYQKDIDLGKSYYGNTTHNRLDGRLKFY